MDPTRWQKVEELVQAALEVPSGDRLAWLDAQSAEQSLREEVISLLDFVEDSNGFLSKPIAAHAAGILVKEDSVLSRQGESIGPYKVIREIGRGGMGTVYLAQRADDQYEKLVAIKLLRRGMDTQDILRRFRTERQILASLEHSHIAHLLDGGMTADGFPYFVLEYIEGLPLDQYCDQHKLSIPERLMLFRKVCAAVQYAHQNLIVHRDLKPSNILVTASGEPKLLDFGIAKLLTPETSSAKAPTLTQAPLMTPAYASPEQILGQNVTTATDIYSLGIVLYELLTGALPYKLKGTPPAEFSGLILDSEPSKPSDAVKNSLNARPDDSKTEQSASVRQLVPLSQLRGDIDNIVLMALRKDPTRRYGSVEQFSEDIERHLKGMPVIARKDTFGYRSSKFLRRNRVGVIAASVVALTVIGGLVTTTWQARVAARERDQARLEKVKSERTKDYLERIFGYSDPLLNKDSEATTIADVLNEAARRLDHGEFSDEPEIRGELEAIIAKTYSYRGEWDLAYKHLLEAITIQTKLYGENDPTTLVTRSHYATALFARGEMTESEKVYLQILPAIRSERNKGTLNGEILAFTCNNFAYLRRTQGDSAGAESLFREALAQSPEMSLEVWSHVNGTARSTLASTIADQGRFDEALETSREAVAEYRRRQETGTPLFGFVLTVFGGFLTDQGNYTEADAALLQSEAIFRKFVQPNSLWLGDNLRNQGISLYRQSKFGEAESKLSESKKIYLNTFGKHYDHYPTVLVMQGLILSKTGNVEEGETLLREALDLRTKSLPPGHFWIAIAKGALGECLTLQKRYDEAEPILTESYASLRTRLSKADPRTREALQRVINLYDVWGKTTQADHYRTEL